MNRRWLVLTTAACVCFTACSTKSGDNEPWSELNSRLVQKHNIKVRTRDVPNNQYPVSVTKQQPIILFSIEDFRSRGPTTCPTNE